MTAADDKASPAAGGNGKESDGAIVAAEAAPSVAVTPAEGLAPVPESAATDDVAALRRERDELRDVLLRRRAEFENYRRRTERERQAWGAEAEAALVQELVPTLDSLDQAIKTDAPEGSLRDGVALLRRDLLATLGRLGLRVHDPVSQPFDPLTDQALLHEEAPGVAEGTVIETYRKGYFFKDRLVRPAIVKVAKAASPGAEPEEPTAPSETAANEVD